MSFRYADGTPFPLDTNFLATSTRLIRVCAQLVANDLVDAGWDDEPRTPLLSILERALPLAELPETEVAVAFAAGRKDGEGSIVISERTYFGLALDATVELDTDTVFFGPFRVREVATGVAAALPERGWFGGVRTDKVRGLERYYVMGATASDHAATLTLARKPGKPAVDVDLRARLYTTADGQRHPMSEADVTALTELWRRVARGIHNRAARTTRRLVAGHLAGVSLARLGNPRALIARLVDAIAPLYAEVLYRSGRSDALVLYENDTLYVVPLREHERVVAQLPAHAREVFVPLGLAAPKPDSGVRPLPLAAMSSPAYASAS